jgi:tetratricopeptide (TPR) repeat protein
MLSIPHLGSLIYLANKKEEHQRKVLVDKGKSFVKSERFLDAIDYFMKAVTLEPSNVEAWYNLGNAMLEIYRYEDAIDCFMKAVTLEPSNVEAWYNLGNAMLELGRYTEAISAYFMAEKHMRGDNLKPKLRYKLAEAVVKDENLPEIFRIEGAIDSLDNGLAVSPSDLNLLSMKATLQERMYEQTRDREYIDSSISSWDEILSKDRNNSEALEGKAHALLLAGDSQGAIEYYEKALANWEKLHKTRRNDPELLEKMADNLMARGRRDDASRYYEQAIQILEQKFKSMFRKDGEPNSNYTWKRNISMWGDAARIYEKLGIEFEKDRFNTLISYLKVFPYAGS